MQFQKIRTCLAKQVVIWVLQWNYDKHFTQGVWQHLDTCASRVMQVYASHAIALNKSWPKILAHVRLNANCFIFTSGCLLLFTFLFSFASFSRIENISIISRLWETSNTTNSGGSRQQWSSLFTKVRARDTLNTSYKPRNIRKNHPLYKQRYNNKEKTASSKLVGVKWCDIHKEWYIRS